MIAIKRCIYHYTFYMHYTYCAFNSCVGMHWQWFQTMTYVILLLQPQQDMWSSWWIYCNPFPAKTFYGSHRLDPVLIRPPGIDNGAFVVLLETVWHAQVLILFSASAKTDTGSKSLDCALVSKMVTYDDPENVCYIYYIYIISIILVICIMCIICIICIICIMYIIFNFFFSQDGWIRLVPRFYTSLTTEKPYCMSSLLSISWENFLLCLLGTQARFPSTCATCFQALLRRSWRPQAGCWRWMQDVVRQLVGNGVVPWHVMNGRWSSARVSHLAPFWHNNWYNSILIWLK
jgi:hypothetical protein